MSPSNLTNNIVSTLRTILGDGTFPLHEPYFNGNETKYVEDCIRSTFVSSVGPYVDRFEKELAEYVGCKRAVSLVNGTSALQMALVLAGVRPGDEVLVPALTFVATANAVTYVQAVPHFVDSSEETLGVDPRALRHWLEEIAVRTDEGAFNRVTRKKISAIIVMHTFGHSCDIEGIIDVANDYSLKVIEDAAESIGSYFRGQHTGTFGFIGTLSFNGNKTITTGGGGAILTNDDKIADRAKYLTTTAKRDHPWEFIHDEVGFNFRMPSINAALGCAQMEQICDFLASKRRLAEVYLNAYASCSELKIMKEPLHCLSNYWLNTIILDPSVEDQRDNILKATNCAGYKTRPVWRLMHYLSAFESCPRAPLPVSESLAKRIINIPSSVGLS